MRNGSADWQALFFVCIEADSSHEGHFSVTGTLQPATLDATDLFVFFLSSLRPPVGLRSLPSLVRCFDEATTLCRALFRQKDKDLRKAFRLFDQDGQSGAQTTGVVFHRRKTPYGRCSFFLGGGRQDSLLKVAG